MYLWIGLHLVQCSMTQFSLPSVTAIIHRHMTDSVVRYPWISLAVYILGGAIDIGPPQPTDTSQTVPSPVSRCLERECAIQFSQWRCFSVFPLAAPQLEIFTEPSGRTVGCIQTRHDGIFIYIVRCDMRSVPYVNCKARPHEPFFWRLR